MATKKTGLGADAIFGVKAPQPQTQQAQPDKAEKMRTTIMLPADAVILLNRLKEQSILDGERQTQGEIIAEAIRTLARHKSIKT